MTTEKKLVEAVNALLNVIEEAVDMDGLSNRAQVELAKAKSQMRNAKITSRQNH